MILKRCVATISLETPAKQRWIELAELYKNTICELVGELEEATEMILEEIQNPVAKTVAQQTVKRLAGGLSSAMLRCLGGEWVQELRGISRVTSIPLGRLVVANMIYDLTQLSERWLPTACSSYSYNSLDGPVLARNMDWSWPDTIGKHTKLVEMVSEHQSYYSVIVPGQVGVLSAFSPGQWAVTLNQAPAEKVPLNFSNPPALISLRNAIDGSLDYSSLKGNLLQAKTATPYFAHMVGVNDHEHAVVTKTPGASLSATNPNGMVQTNHYVHQMKNLNPSAESEELEGWEEDSCDRFKMLTNAVQSDPETVLMQEPVFNEATMQSMVFEPGSRRKKLWTHPR